MQSGRLLRAGARLRDPGHKRFTSRGPGRMIDPDTEDCRDGSM